MSSILNGLIDLLYPNLCLICGESLRKNEQQLCLHCFNNIPKTNYHLMENNPVEKRFWGKVPLQKGSSYFHFRKGSDFQKLIHELKYRGNREMGITLGRYAASELITSGSFDEVDILVPVPLHPKKEAKRGYNQSFLICKGLEEVLGKPVVSNNLYRKHYSSTQTKKSVFERYENTAGIFALRRPEEFAGKHILLVDDVLTTGATLEACVQTLLDVDSVDVSVFTLAVTE